MNEKIRELAITAGMEDYPTYGVNALHGEKYIAKFAELIIQECCRVCMELGTYESAVSDIYYIDLDLKGSDYVKYIKDRFGLDLEE